MRALVFFVLLCPFALFAQVDPANFYRSSEPMEVLAAYCHIVGCESDPGISEGPVGYKGIVDETFGQSQGKGLFSPNLFKTPESWAHLDVNLYVHPAMVPLIAKILGWKEEQVWAVAQFEAGYSWDEINPIEDMDEALLGYSGPEILARELGTVDPLMRLRSMGLRNSDLVFSKVPVPPLSHRPRQVMPGGQEMGGPINDCLAGIAYFAHFYPTTEEKEMRRYLDLNIQRHFAALIKAMAQPEGISLLHTVPFPSPVHVEFSNGGDIREVENDGDSWPKALAFVDDERLLLLDFPDLIVYDLKAEKRLLEVPVPGFQFVGLDKNRQTALLTNYDALAQIELESGKWRQGFLPGMNYAIAEESSEITFLHDWKSGHVLRLWMIPDYLDLLAYSPDRKYVWAQDREGSGNIFDLETGFPVAYTGKIDFYASAPYLGPEPGDDELELGNAAALGMYKNKWLMFKSNALYYDGQAVFQLDMNVEAAAFDLKGMKLALLGPGKLCMIDLEKGLESGKIADFAMKCSNW